MASISRIEDLLEEIVKLLVDTPERVVVVRNEGTDAVNFVVRTACGETGQVIGKQGRVGNALRTILKSIARKDGEKPVYLDIQP